MPALVAVYVIPGIFGIVPLALEHWGYVLVLSLITFLFVEATKWFDYINRPQTEAGCRVE